MPLKSSFSELAVCLPLGPFFDREKSFSEFAMRLSCATTNGLRIFANLNTKHKKKKGTKECLYRRKKNKKKQSVQNYGTSITHLPVILVGGGDKNPFCSGDVSFIAESFSPGV